MANNRPGLKSEEVMASTPISTRPQILCVDDRVSSLEVRRALLTAAGYDVFVASDPDSAVAIADKVKIDLVVLDYSFPGHRSGEELARELRARQPGLRQIMLSGFPDLPASARQSVDTLLVKGVAQPADLLAAIAHLLHRPQGNSGTVNLYDTSRRLVEESRELVHRVRDQRKSNGKHSR